MVSSPGGEGEAYILIGGPQGGGLETSAQVLSTAYAYRGYGVAATREYHSNIIGRHSYVLYTVHPRRLVRYFNLPVHVAAFMDAESVFTHYRDVAPGGILVYDAAASKMPLEKIVSMEEATRRRIERELSELGVEPVLESLVDYLRGQGVRVAALDYRALLAKLAEKYGVPRALLRRYTSAIVAGAVAGATGLDEEALEAGFRRRFAKRPKLVEPNVYLAMLAAEETRSQAGSIDLPPGGLEVDRLLIVTGNEAVAIAKAAAGLRFQSYYPITPAQDESFYLEEHEVLETSEGSKGSIVVLQTEDELAAMAAAIGAALAGARAATATSGPGFDLMVEGLSWAGMNEVPVVLTLYQRGGPSTGLPTRGAQEDLKAALFAGHGEFPRIVIASGDHEEAFHDVFKAFNLAEKYQLPVIHLLDKFLANSFVAMKPPRIEEETIDRGRLSREPPSGGYKRFPLEEPVPLRLPLGAAPMWYTGTEHDEYGHVSEDPVVRMKMVERRMKKLELVDRDVPERGERAILYPESKPSRIDILLVGWGSVKGPAVEAVERLRDRGVAAAYLHLRYFAPFPSRYVYAVVKGVKQSGGRVAAVEHNYSAQAAEIVEMNTGVIVPARIVKYTGRPIYLGELLDAVEQVLNGAERVVLSRGA